MYLGITGCIRKRVVLFRQDGCIWIKVLYSGKSGCIRAKVVVFGQSGCNWKKSCCFRTKRLYTGKCLYSAKVVVFGQSGCVR